MLRSHVRYESRMRARRAMAAAALCCATALAVAPGASGVGGEPDESNVAAGGTYLVLGAERGDGSDTVEVWRETNNHPGLQRTVHCHMNATGGCPPIPPDERTL